MSNPNPKDGGDSSNRGFIASLLSIPSTIFDRGADHGRQWREASDGHQKKTRECSRSRRDRQEASRSSATATQQSNENPPPQYNNNPKVNVDEWFHEVAKEFEKREQIAKDFYNSWNPVDGTSEASKFSAENKSPQSPSWPTPLIADLEQSFDRLWQWGKRPEGMPSQETLFQQLFDMTSQLENEIPQKLMMPGIGFPLMGKRLDPFLNDSIASGYSPLQLEQKDGFDNSWRVRFEDLVRASNDRPLLSKEEAEQVKRQTWSKWLVDFQSRNQPLEEQDRQRGCAQSKRREHCKRNSWRSEEKTSIAEQTKDAWKQKKEESQVQENGDARESCFRFSSVTETRQSRTNPDGSVTTSVNSARRFPDGRVEISENTETTPSPSRLIQKEIEQTSQIVDDNSKKGWFWHK